MINISPLHPGRKYSIQGKEFTCERIKHFGAQLAGVRIGRFYSDDGEAYVATQWQDGSIYRITREF